MKCDEAFPVCMNCLSSCRVQHKFHYFLHSVDFSLGGGLDNELWAKLLPTVASQDDMIWDAV